MTHPCVPRRHSLVPSREGALMNIYELSSETSKSEVLDSNVTMFLFEFTFPHRGIITVEQLSSGCLK